MNKKKIEKILYAFCAIYIVFLHAYIYCLKVKELLILTGFYISKSRFEHIKLKAEVRMIDIKEEIIEIKRIMMDSLRFSSQTDFTINEAVEISKNCK